MTGKKAYEAAVRERAALIEVGSADDVLRYLREGNLSAALELLANSASLHEACGNQRKADALNGLASLIERKYSAPVDADNIPLCYASDAQRRRTFELGEKSWRMDEHGIATLPSGHRLARDGSEVQ